MKKWWAFKVSVGLARQEDKSFLRTFGLIETLLDDTEMAYLKDKTESHEKVFVPPASDQFGAIVYAEDFAQALARAVELLIPAGLSNALEEILVNCRTALETRDVAAPAARKTVCDDTEAFEKALKDVRSKSRISLPHAVETLAATGKPTVEVKRFIRQILEKEGYWCEAEKYS